MFFNYLSEIWYRLYKNSLSITFIINTDFSFFFLNSYNITMQFVILVFSSIQIIQILNVIMFSKCHRQSIHRMMTMIVSLGPIFNNFDSLAKFTLLHFSQTKCSVFW